VIRLVFLALAGAFVLVATACTGGEAGTDDDDEAVCPDDT
jgi:hypothetical protein